MQIRTRSIWFRSTVCAAVLALGAEGAAAAEVVPIAGSISDGAGGPLLPGKVYHVVNNLSVPAGTTLTVHGGAIVKFGSHVQMIVDGTLNLAGSALSPVVFSSLRDDLSGGDTNGDGGVTSPAPGDWYGVVFNADSDASVLDHLHLLYAGSPFYGNAGLTLSYADITMRDCVVAGCLWAALDLTAFGGASGSLPDVRSSTFHSNGGRAIANARLDAVPGFVDNVAYGNAGGNSMHVVSASVASDMEIFAGNCLEGALVIANNVNVAEGSTLTLHSGVVFKFASPLIMNVEGTLSTGGTVPAPVVFTSLADDSIAGDTNNDGPSSGAPGDWIGMQLGANSDASFLYGVEVRHAGWPFYAYAGITLNQSDATLDHCVIRDCAYAGLQLSNNSLPTVNLCEFRDNGGGAVTGAPIEAIPGFTLNDASGNGGNYIDVPYDATAAWDLAITTLNLIDDVLVLGNHLAVVPGVVLTLQDGVVLKLRPQLKVEIEGALHVNGMANRPVVITSIADDSAAGDTNGDGPSTGAPGDWIGMYFREHSDSSYANYFEVRHAGWPFYAAAGITLDRSDAQLANCRISDCAYSGLDLASFGGGVGSLPTVTSSSFDDNGGFAVANARLDAVPNFSLNSASGNGGGNYIRLNEPWTSSRIAISRTNVLGDVLVFANNGAVAPGASLTLESGVIVKMASTYTFTVQGALNLLGTAFEPVVFTSLRDDAFGGDTNQDGPSSGTPADWESIRVEAGAAPSLLENVVLRYGGWAYAAAMLTSASPNLTARSIRAEHGAGGGIEASAHAGPAQNWVAFDCAGIGIRLTGGAFDLVHATSASNASFGIYDQGHTGGIHNSIGWGNASDNFGNFSAGDLHSCDGSPAHAGSNGNIDLDPLFVDSSRTAGDLRLRSGSPCMNAAGPSATLAVLCDHDENSRWLDGYLDGTLQPDMGAYEYSPWSMRVNGEPRIGETLTFVVTGAAPAVSFYVLGLLDGDMTLAPFGFVTVGLAPVQLGIRGVNKPFEFLIPDEPALVGANAGIQTITHARFAPPYGNVTNRYRFTVLP